MEFFDIEFDSSFVSKVNGHADDICHALEQHPIEPININIGGESSSRSVVKTSGNKFNGTTLNRKLK